MYFMKSERLTKLQQLCTDCIERSDIKALKAAANDADPRTILLMGQVSAHMVYKVLFPAMKEFAPEIDVQHLRKEVTMPDVLAEILGEEFAVRHSQYKSLIEAITRNRLLAQYALEKLKRLENGKAS